MKDHRLIAQPPMLIGFPTIAMTAELNVKGPE